MTSPPAETTFFRSPGGFRRWLERNHDRASELEVGLYKTASGKGGITYHEALDEALCFGWIDGVRRGRDDESYTIRFTPRRSTSVWSHVNIDRAHRLVEAGRMTPAGLEAFESRDPERTNRYSFEQGDVRFGPAERRAFRANAAAWTFFQAQPPSYRTPATWWVMSAKKEETRRRRLGTLIEHSAKGDRIPPLARRSKPT